MRCFTRATYVLAMLSFAAVGQAQLYDNLDKGQPGDEMIQAYLAAQAARLESNWLPGVKTLDDWQKVRPQLEQDYFTMLGLWPLPERTPLKPTITRSMKMDGYIVDMLHYQSRPGLYVTGNLYRPLETKPGERLPAVFYVCGHSNQGRNGNKSAYQGHGIWFARHGYVCLVVDTLQLGEIASFHHGTYNLDRWSWHSRGYTPAGVECWNGIRGIDYLTQRDDVDPERIAVTGISGGGASTFWIAAADPRVKVAVPVSGMADLTSLVSNRVINGHCDCMFLYNSMQWPWATIAALIAPRPQLFVNSDADPIFPMDANERISNRLERIYSIYGASDRVDAVVSSGGHDYRKDIRQAAYRFINTHLKNDPRPVEDSEIDVTVYKGNKQSYPIEPEKLRVFSTDNDIPSDQLNVAIDERFVPMAQVAPPQPGEFDSWKRELIARLRQLPLRHLPDEIPAAKPVDGGDDDDTQRLATEAGIQIVLRPRPTRIGNAKRVVLLVAGEDGAVPEELREQFADSQAVFVLQPRGTGDLRWTRRNPPNYVERSLALLGQTADTGRIWDIAATASYLSNSEKGEVAVTLAGEGAAGVLAAYAALFAPNVNQCFLLKPRFSHMDSGSPQLLSVLRVCDVEDVLGMLAPRKLSIADAPREPSKVAAIYEAAGAGDALSIKNSAAK